MTDLWSYSRTNGHKSEMLVEKVRTLKYTMKRRKSKIFRF